MSKPWLSKTLQIVGMMALVTLAVIVYRGTDWCKGFTPDGIMTLIAGMLAFAAVQWQMWDQRRTLRQEQDRQNRAVATAILFEIDSVFRSKIRETGKTLEDTSNQEFVVKPYSLWFSVYEGNSIKLGQLPPNIVQEIVSVYGTLKRHLVTLQEYSTAVKNAHAALHEDGVDWDGMASRYRTEVVQGTPVVTLQTYYVSKHLCEYTGVKFESPTIAVAAENVDLLNKKLSEIESSGTNKGQ